MEYNSVKEIDQAISEAQDKKQALTIKVNNGFIKVSKRGKVTMIIHTKPVRNNEQKVAKS